MKGQRSKVKGHSPVLEDLPSFYPPLTSVPRETQWRHESNMEHVL